MAAALATLEVLESKEVIPYLIKIGSQLMSGFNKIFQELGIRAKAHRHPSQFHLIFEDAALEEAFYKKIHSYGILLHPFDPQMVSFSHTEADINHALESTHHALLELRSDFPESFNKPFPGEISQDTIDFRTLHEFGGVIDYKKPSKEVIHTWFQEDR